MAFLETAKQLRSVKSDVFTFCFTIGRIRTPMMPYLDDTPLTNQDPTLNMSSIR